MGGFGRGWVWVGFAFCAVSRAAATLLLVTSAAMAIPRSCSVRASP
jgi:hypothetical protein